MYIEVIDFKLNVINDVFNDEDKNERIVVVDYDRFLFFVMMIFKKWDRVMDFVI